MLCLQAQQFFETLPSDILKALRAEACIPTEGGRWVRPSEAVLCIGDPTPRQLLADPRLEGITPVSYVDPRLTVLHKKADLARHLGVKQLDCKHLVTVLEEVHHKGLAPTMGHHWCARMLACSYDMLAEQEPTLCSSMRLQAPALSSRVQAVVDRIRALSVFLLSSGDWTSVNMAPAGSMFKPVLPVQQPSAPVAAVPRATAPGRQQQESGKLVASMLAHCNLEVGTMQLHTVDAGFVEAAGEEHQDSLVRMMQASICSSLAHALQQLLASCTVTLGDRQFSKL